MIFGKKSNKSDDSKNQFSSNKTICKINSFRPHIILPINVLRLDYQEILKNKEILDPM